MGRRRPPADRVWRALLPYVVSGLVLPTGATFGTDARAPHIISFCVRNADRLELRTELEREHGVLASAGSACGTDSALPSHVLAALAVPREYVFGSVRAAPSASVCVWAACDRYRWGTATASTT